MGNHLWPDKGYGNRRQAESGMEGQGDPQI